MRQPTVFTLSLLLMLALAIGLDRSSANRAAERKREALGRMRRGRTWDRRAPDHADEPPDDIWSREAQRSRSV